MSSNYKRTSITLPVDLLEEAHQYNINISAASTNGIRAAIDREKKIQELGL